MKNFLITLVILSTYQGFCQSSKDKVSLGFQAGLNRSSINIYDEAEFTEDTEARNSFNLTVFCSYHFSKDWGIKPKLIFDKKGFNEGDTVIWGDILTKADYKLSYLTIPILLDWYFGKGNPHYIGAGPYLGLLLNAKNGFDDPGVVKDKFRNADFGFHFNLGTTKKLSDKFKLAMELGSSIGLSKINKDNGQILSGDQDAVIKNMLVYFNLGFVFNNVKSAISY